MKQLVRNFTKRAISATLPDSERLRSLVSRTILDTWRKSRARDVPFFDERTKMYDFLMRDALGADPIDFLEFGVY